MGRDTALVTGVRGRIVKESGLASVTNNLVGGGVRDRAR